MLLIRTKLSKLFVPTLFRSIITFLCTLLFVVASSLASVFVSAFTVVSDCSSTSPSIVIDKNYNDKGVNRGNSVGYVLVLVGNGCLSVTVGNSDPSTDGYLQVSAVVVRPALSEGTFPSTFLNITAKNLECSPDILFNNYPPVADDWRNPQTSDFKALTCR